MKRNGFTLIELLAVIIILAVIALIATPIVLNVVDEAKLKAAESSVNGYVNAVEAARYEYILKNDMAEPAWSDLDGKVTTKGETVTCETPTITNGVFASTNCKTASGYSCAVVGGTATKCAKGDTPAA